MRPPSPAHPQPARFDRAKWSALGLIIAAQLLALSVWFAGAAALPDLVTAAPLAAWRRAALTSAVQAGFVIGALASALAGLPDRFDARHVFAVGAVIAALANLAALGLEPGSLAMIASRLIAGAGLALVYPVGMKLAASWGRGDTGLLVGLLVAALTLGSALPFAVQLAGSGLDWRLPFTVSAALAVLAAGLVLKTRIGPAWQAAAFNPAAARLAIRDPALRLANLGYLGHMWELYALWAWIGPFAHAYWARRDAPAAWGDLTAFATIAVGTIGCILAGRLADRHGRTAITIAALAVSGSCALLAGPLFHAAPLVLILVLMVWGISVIADSAQFSAAITELAPPGTTGTLLTLQTALGFALTALMVQLLPLWIEAVGWTWAFTPLAIGPAVGIVAMVRLRARPEAVKMAGGMR
ncbi:MFS transporter [Maricaulis sp. CAU 1757]